MEAIKYNTFDKLNENVFDVIGEYAMVSIIDSFGRIEFVNDNFCDILEYDVNKLIGETLDFIKSPLHTGLLYKDLWGTIKSGLKWNGVLSADTRSGNSIKLDTSIVPIKKEGSTIYIILCMDVTLHHHENNTLLESDNRSQAFLNNMPLHVFSITKYGKILNVNKSFCDVEKEDLIGDYIYDYMGLSSYEVFKNNIYDAFENKISKQFDFFDFDRDGRKSFYFSIVSPVFDTLGIIDSLSLCIHEITENMGISKEARDREDKYRLIYKSINVGIIVVADHNGKICEWNKGAKLAFGYTEKQILGRPLTVLTSEQYREPNIKEFIKAIKKIKNNQNVDIIEMQCQRKNGDVFPVEFTLSSLRANGKISYCAMMIDITNRKSLQNKLKQKTKDLELFLYRSAHDLQAPFSSAQGLLNLLKEETDKDKAQVLIEMLSTTINSGRILSNNLSEASMISAKKHEYRRINFNKIIDDVLITLCGSKNFEHINFRIDIDVYKSFKSKPELITSIFQNLIQNAIKYANDLTKTHIPSIEIIVKTKNDGISILVCDNGPGIDLKCIDKIFDLYYRSNNEDVPGSGLGLYIVKNIVDGLNGTIKVSSDANDGTCFEIHLPISK